VSIAQLAQAIISDRRNHSAETPPDSITRQVRISRREHEIPVPAGAHRITDVVVTEIIRLAGDSGQPDSGQLPLSAEVTSLRTWQSRSVHLTVPAWPGPFATGRIPANLQTASD
jgi:hypothetical protein